MAVRRVVTGHDESGKSVFASEQDPSNVEDAVADIEAKLPGLPRYMDPSDPGMHATDTIDFEVVLEGTVVCRPRDGRRHRVPSRRARQANVPHDDSTPGTATHPE
jgi:hypothetical protein